MRKAIVIVAHPDDETLWCGGTILRNLLWEWHVLTLCRASDPDRSEKFYQAMKIYNARGQMADVDDGPDQTPIAKNVLVDILKNFVPKLRYDLCITHSPFGEYTKHRRHEETGNVVIDLWRKGKIHSPELRLFAYNDTEGTQLPIAIAHAHITDTLPYTIWQKKYDIMTTVYGFTKNSFEAKTTPKTEAFWSFNRYENIVRWINERRID